MKPFVHKGSFHGKDHQNSGGLNLHHRATAAGRLLPSLCLALWDTEELNEKCQQFLQSFEVGSRNSCWSVLAAPVHCGSSSDAVSPVLLGCTQLRGHTTWFCRWHGPGPDPAQSYLDSEAAEHTSSIQKKHLYVGCQEPTCLLCV